MHKHLKTHFSALFFCCALATISPAQSISPDTLDARIREATKYLKEGEHDKGVQLLLQHLATARRENLPKSAGQVYYYLAFASDRLQDVPGTMRYLQLSRQEYEKAGNAPVGVGNAWLFTAVAHARMKQFDSAMICAEKSIGFFKIADRPDRLAQANVKIGNIIEMQGKFAQATPYYQEYFDFAKQQNDSATLGFAHTYLAFNLYSLKKYHLAEQHAEQILKLLPAEKTPFDHGVGLQYLSGIREGLGDFRGALEFERKYSQLRDSTMTRERSQQVAEMEARFQNNQKQAEIQLLEKDKSRQRTVIWSVLALLSVVLAATFFIFRANQKKTAANRALAAANEILAAQKTEIEAKNQQNELLLKEIHHRVKNNLQVVSSLLDLQAQHVRDESTLDALREGQNRVESMGLIHQKLYLGDNLTSIEMGEYLKNLTDFLLASFGKTPAQIKTKLEIAELRLDVDTAIPLGLICNELITNALKYAFPENRPGELHIGLAETSENNLLLSIADTGGGAAENLPKGTGFGNQLVRLLSKKLDGTVETNTSPEGTEVLVHFKKYKKV